MRVALTIVGHHPCSERLVDGFLCHFFLLLLQYVFASCFIWDGCAEAPFSGSQEGVFCKRRCRLLAGTSRASRRQRQTAQRW